MPYEGRFGFKTHVPIKVIGEGEFQFLASAASQSTPFIPVSSEAPFAQLQNIRYATFAFNEGQVGVIIPDKDPQDNDQSQAH